jgi:hypothetical protein
MNRTSLVMRGIIVAFAFFAIEENAASAQTFLPGPAWTYAAPPALQWTPAPMFVVPASPLRTYSPARPAFRLGSSRGDNSRLDWLPANQPKGACRRRTAARGLELQRSGL